MRCSPTVNVERLKPFHARADAPPAPGPVSDLVDVAQVFGRAQILYRDAFIQTGLAGVVQELLDLLAASAGFPISLKCKKVP